jgi:hypothetical protein
MSRMIAMVESRISSAQTGLENLLRFALTA